MDISSLLYIIIRSTTTTELRQMIYLHAARNVFDSEEIVEIGWMNRERNVTDSLAKNTPWSAMMNPLAHHWLQTDAPQWVPFETSTRKLNKKYLKGREQWNEFQGGGESPQMLASFHSSRDLDNSACDYLDSGQCQKYDADLGDMEPGLEV